MDGNTRICKKCLLREMDEAGFFQNMYDYIARIPADDKAPDANSGSSDHAFR